MSDSDTRGGRPAGRFTTTQWSLVVAAGDPENPTVRQALNALCNDYWQPIYVFLRRRGAERERALELTQGFFAKLLEKNYVGDARQERGRFRTFLLTSLKNYIANEWDRESALKRGGGEVLLSIDSMAAEDAYRFEPSHDETPERLFDRRWARTLLNTSLSRLRDEARGSGHLERFQLLVPFLGGDAPSSYREVAEGLGMTEPAARVSVHRMRRRFRAILRDEVARTVEDESHVDAELDHLFKVLGS